METNNSDLRKLQEKSIELLVAFKDFCDKNNLLFYFCGGCCIGTLRHNGFIPWDDDIDVFMPRKDYERLSELWPKEVNPNKYKLCRSDKNNFYRSMLTAISDEETTFIKERQQDLNIPHGVRIEILPLDGCPESNFKRKMQLFWALLFQIYNLEEAPISKGKYLEILGKIMLFIVPTHTMRYHVWHFAEKKMSKYNINDCKFITELCARWQYMRNKYPKEAFESAIYKDFEGLKMPIPIGYDDYLKIAFGDYMTLPPESEQIPKHDAVYIDLEHGYKRYYGIHYNK